MAGQNSAVHFATNDTDPNQPSARSRTNNNSFRELDDDDESVESAKDISSASPPVSKPSAQAGASHPSNKTVVPPQLVSGPLHQQPRGPVVVRSTTSTHVPQQGVEGVKQPVEEHPNRQPKAAVTTTTISQQSQQPAVPKQPKPSNVQPNVQPTGVPLSSRNPNSGPTWDLARGLVTPVSANGNQTAKSTPPQPPSPKIKQQGLSGSNRVSGVAPPPPPQVVIVPESQPGSPKHSPRGAPIRVSGQVIGNMGGLSGTERARAKHSVVPKTSSTTPSSTSNNEPARSQSPSSSSSSQPSKLPVNAGPPVIGAPPPPPPGWKKQQASTSQISSSSVPVEQKAPEEKPSSSNAAVVKRAVRANPVRPPTKKDSSDLPKNMDY